MLLGENGAGKSTLIAMLAGLQQPDEGAIRVAGREEAITSPRRALALGIGTVFQHVMLVPTLTVAENIALGGAWWRTRNRAEQLARAQGDRRQHRCDGRCRRSRPGRSRSANSSRRRSFAP